MNPKRNVYQLVTERIIERLEAGVVPWHKPWRSAVGMPRNLVSGREYRGVNVFVLGCMDKVIVELVSVLDNRRK